MTVELNFNVDDYLEQAVKFLHDNEWIFKSSNTEYLKNNILKNLPEEWIQTFETCTENEFKNIPSGYCNINWPESVKGILDKIETLKPTFETISHFYDKKLLNKVSPKKLYEIQQLSTEINNICKDDIDIYLDLGAGLGYLSQMLHENYNYKILGLEADDKRRTAALARQDKYYPTSKDKVKYVTLFIKDTSGEFILEQIGHLFGIDPSSVSIGIIGLHACGDLTLTAIRLYYNLRNARKLIIMPCCYHKLSYENESLGTFNNIPASSKMRNIFLNNKLNPNIINRPFLRLACQETATRWNNKGRDEHEKQGAFMYERALIEAILSPEEFVVKSKTNNNELNRNLSFVYLINKYNLKKKMDKSSLDWETQHEDKYNLIVEQYPNGCKLSIYLLCLQNAIQIICENVVHLDRISLIQEMSHKMVTRKIKTKLKKIQNDSLSPRCFILIIEEQ